MTLSYCRAHSRAFLVLTSLSSVLSLAAACGGGEPAMPDGGPPAPDAYFAPRDAGPPCANDLECADEVECTLDSCDMATHRCRNQVDPAVCDNHVFCDGVEICDTRHGCVPGPRVTCDDGEVCTIDRCDEENKSCDTLRTPRDLDLDGDPDFFCPDQGGMDCDDRDRTRSSRVAEICTDGIDNDCDKMIDESMCGRPPNDLCDDALDVSAGGVFTVNTDGAAPDYRTTCSTDHADLVLTFTITGEPQDVRIEAEADFTPTTLALRTSCADRVSEIECRNEYRSLLRRRALSPGTYFVILQNERFPGIGDGLVDVTVEFSPATVAPTNEACGMPIVIDGTTGGSFEGSMVDVTDELSTDCGGFESPDLVYQFTTTEPSDVQITATSATGDAMAWELRPACDTTVGALRCMYGSPAGGRMHTLAPNTYYLVLEGPSYVEVDFQLSVTFSAPTEPMAGDVCATALPLALGTPTSGSLVGMEDDVETTCGFHYPDAVYTFNLESASDITLTVDGSGSYVNAALSQDCGASLTELRCISGIPARSRVRALPAGRYYVVAEASRAVPFELTVEATPPAMLVPVTDNDTCATAHVIPETGGFFSGNTTTMLNDLTTTVCPTGAPGKDAAFVMTLTGPAHVVASTEGSAFDTVLHIHRGSCVSGGELYCNDDAVGTSSVIDADLDAGTYFFVVDGWNAAASGNYVFEVIVSEP